MYDDDSENSQKGFGKGVGNLAKGATGGVKRVARGTRRMSLMAAGNVKNVATKLPGNVTKVAAGTVKVGVGAVGNAARGAGDIVTGKKGKKGKKKKKKKKQQDRGRSESPRRTANSKPPVTKASGNAVKGIKSMFSPKRWRSASPAVNRKNKKGDTVDEEELEPLPVAPAQQQRSFQQPANGFDDGGQGGYNGDQGGYSNGGGGGGAGGYDQQQGGGRDPMHQSRGKEQQQAVNIGASLQSQTSDQRHQRLHQQQKIERDCKVPFFSGFLHTNNRFASFCDTVFDSIDLNGDEAVDETELYAGLLLMHLKLGCFLGPAACRPLSRDRCSAMFNKFDSTGRGGLDRNEFRSVIMVLFANVLARVAIQFTLTIFVVPLVAKSVRNFLTIDTEGWWDFWTKPKALRRMGLEFTLDDAVDWKVTCYPSSRRSLFTSIYRFFRLGSDEFWETFPLTFLTVILGLVIAPLVLYLIDDAFHIIADKSQPKRVASRSRKSTTTR